MSHSSLVVRFGVGSVAAPLVGLALVPVSAGPPPLVTDRPDQTESALVVPRRSVQVETGWVFSRDDEDGVRTRTSDFLNTLVRVGLFERLELRAGWSGYLDQDVSLPGPDVEAEGIGDTSIGTKLHLRRERGGLPELSLIAGLSLPTGADDVSSDGTDPAVRLSAAHTLTERLGLGYNLGVAWETLDGGNRSDDTLSRYLYTAALGIGVSDRVGAFVELFGDAPASDRGGPAHSVDGGVTFLLLDNVQLDASAGIGLSEEADDWFVSAGLSLRLPE